MLSKHSEMPFGPHKGEMMCDVDPGYLLRLHKVFKDDPEKPVFGRMKLVLDYVDKNYEKLKKQFYKEHPPTIEGEVLKRKYDFDKRNKHLGKRL